VQRCWVVVGVIALVGLAVPSSAHAATSSPGSVTATIQVPRTRVRAGATVHGSLVLTNHSGAPVDLKTTCTPKWQVVLGSGKEPPGVAFSQECGVDPFIVKAGTTQLPFTLSTSYAGCAPDAASVSRDLPRCRANGRPPPLPRGRYHAFLVTSDPSFPQAAPAPIRLVRLVAR
jgi:hypothetical protein